jgi:hypothetical protein
MTNKQINKLLGTIICRETMHFQMHQLIYDVSPNFQTFQKVYNIRQFFFTELIRGIGWWQRCCLCSEGCEHLGTGWWPLRKREPSGRRKWPYWNTTCRRTGTCRYHFWTWQFPHWAAPQRWHVWRISSKLILNCTHTMWKMSVKSAAIEFVTQA